MHIDSLKDQFKNNFIAIISLIIAIIALLYTAWREEATEKHRNIRIAGFEVLKNLGELQIVVNQTYYMPESAMGNPYLGWGHIALISDLSQVLPSPVPETVAKLINVWDQNWDHIKGHEEALDLITQEIDTSRKVVLEEVRSLS